MKDKNLKEMKHTLDKTKLKPLISALILSKHNPFQDNIPIIKWKEMIVEEEEETKNVINDIYGSCFRNIFSKPHNILKGRIPCDHLIFINDVWLKSNNQKRVNWFIEWEKKDLDDKGRNLNLLKIYKSDLTM